jgi:hypothetical protein
VRVTRQTVRFGELANYLNFAKGENTATNYVVEKIARDQLMEFMADAKINVLR